MRLKVYDSAGSYVNVPNAASREHALQHAREYAKLEGELRVVKIVEIELPWGENDDEPK